MDLYTEIFSRSSSVDSDNYIRFILGNQLKANIMQTDASKFNSTTIV